MWRVECSESYPEIIVFQIKVEASGYRPYEDLIRLDHDLTITIELERGK